MKKNPSWKIGICLMTNYMVSVEAPNEETAIALAKHLLTEEHDEYVTNVTEGVTGVFINDRESKDYHTYVDEFTPHNWEENV